MNKTAKIALWVGATLVISYWVFTDGDDYTPSKDALTYDSVEACIKPGEHDAETCQSEYDKAEKLHTEVAPKYSNSNQCYSDFGYNRCYQSTYSGTSVWLPFMMGYMLAPRGTTFVDTQPLYRTASSPNSYHTARGGRVDRADYNGRTKVANNQASKPKARTRTVARGGFGARAASRSSGA